MKITRQCFDKVQFHNEFTQSTNSISYVKKELGLKIALQLI